MSIVFDFKDIRSRIKGDPWIGPKAKAKMKCAVGCPGDDTCDNHKWCMCGMLMQGHTGHDGFPAISVHENYSRLNQDDI